MVRDLDISLLRAFAAVASAGGMTAAAKRLGLTQGAVSQRIARLEVTLNRPLFDRRSKRLPLTADGERLLCLSSRLLELHDDIRREMTDMAVGGTVRMGMPYDLVAPFLPFILEGMAESHPEVTISPVFGASPELADCWRRGEIDLAIVEEPVGASQGECLRVERLVWVGCREGTAYRRRPLPLSIVSESCALRPVIHRTLDAAGTKWTTVFEHGSVEATTITVRSDLAVTACLASAVPKDLLVLGPESGLPPLPSFAINLYRHEIDPNPAVRYLAHHVREGIQKGEQVA